MLLPHASRLEAIAAVLMQRRALAACLLAVLATVSGGCRSFSPRLSSSELNEGYTLLLPGVLGHAPWDNNVASGLAEAGVPGAIEVDDWTAGPFLWTYNTVDRDFHLAQGKKIAAKIVDYQNRYPGRPVHVIGHSGGAAAAIRALEQLPPERKVTSAVLLAPGVPADYDLRLAMSHTQAGIHNFYSPYDVLLSALYLPARATRTEGDGSAAGTIGFHPPAGIAAAEQAWYESKLRQHPFESGMFEDGHLGDHFGWTNPTVVANWIAPVLKEPWPDVRRLPQTPGGVAVQTVESNSAQVVPVSATLHAPHERYPSGAPEYVDLRSPGR
jgi:pimeloyl-ACP methyl ester carboxylesterase